MANVLRLIRIETYCEAPLALRNVIFFISLVFFVIILIIVLFFLFRLGIALLVLAIFSIVKNRPIWLDVFRRAHNLWASEASRPCHVEILKFKLLYPCLKSPVVLSKLDQLSIDGIYRELCSFVTIKRSIHVELAILSVALCKDTFDIVRDKLLVVLTVVLQYAFDKLETLA